MKKDLPSNLVLVGIGLLIVTAIPFTPLIMLTLVFKLLTFKAHWETSCSQIGCFVVFIYLGIRGVRRASLLCAGLFLLLAITACTLLVLVSCRLSGS